MAFLVPWGRGGGWEAWGSVDSRRGRRRRRRTVTRGTPARSPEGQGRGLQVLRLTAASVPSPKSPESLQAHGACAVGLHVWVSRQELRLGTLTAAREAAAGGWEVAGQGQPLRLRETLSQITSKGTRE